MTAHPLVRRAGAPSEVTQQKVVKDEVAKDRARAHLRVTRQSAKLPTDTVFSTPVRRMWAAIDAATNVEQLRKVDQANARQLARLKSAGAQNTALQAEAVRLRGPAPPRRCRPWTPPC